VGLIIVAAVASMGMNYLVKEESGGLSACEALKNTPFLQNKIASLRSANVAVVVLLMPPLL